MIERVEGTLRDLITVADVEQVNHAVRAWRDGRQLALWADIDAAPRTHMEKAFAQRRGQIVGDCHQLRLDLDHYNGAHPEEEQLELILDFTEDVAEMLIAEGIEDDDAA